jgi:hypothetical protein
MNNDNRYRVVDYYDLRPLDWMSGKRRPLEPGEGHVCDRCGAEHALVYVVEDTTTHKQYNVGSGCAKQSFGFDPSQDKEARAIVKGKQRVADEQVNDRRLDAATELANKIAEEVGRLRRPEVVLEREVPSKYPSFAGQKIRVYKVGADVEVEDWEQSGEAKWNTRQAEELAIYRWVANRIAERIPSDWPFMTVYLNPSKPRSTTTLKQACESMARRKLAHEF